MQLGADANAAGNSRRDADAVDHLCQCDVDARTGHSDTVADGRTGVANAHGDESRGKANRDQDAAISHAGRGRAERDSRTGVLAGNSQSLFSRECGEAYYQCSRVKRTCVPV